MTGDVVARIGAQLRDLSTTRDRLDELIVADGEHRAGQPTASSR